MISIIVPAYNAEVWLKDCLEGILAQSFREIEVVVVDDGSNDGTAKLTKSIDDHRLRLIRQSNGGQSQAINRGVEESRGRFIKLVDADDWINPGHLERQFHSLDGTKDVLSACGWGYFVEAPANTRARPEATDRDYDDPLEWLVDSLTLDEGMMGGWKWLIPRTVWERSGGYDEQLSLNNDFDFSIRLLLASQGVRFAKGAIYAYRKGVSGALSGSVGRRAMESAFRTTEAGCATLLAREDSLRIRKICADRWQFWLFKFYPEFPDLANGAEQQIRALGGSSLQMGGGRLMRMLEPWIGWRGVRQVQSIVYRCGWHRILALKSKRRLSSSVVG